MRLFWCVGDQVNSIAELTKVMGIASPSLYGVFGEKKRLLLETVDRNYAGAVRPGFATGRRWPTRRL